MVFSRLKWSYSRWIPSFSPLCPASAVTSQHSAAQITILLSFGQVCSSLLLKSSLGNLTWLESLTPWMPLSVELDCWSGSRAWSHRRSCSWWWRPTWDCAAPSVRSWRVELLESIGDIVLVNACRSSFFWWGVAGVASGYVALPSVGIEGRQDTVLFFPYFLFLSNFDYFDSRFVNI